MKPHGVQRNQGSPGSTLGIARRAGGGGSVCATLVPLWVRFGLYRHLTGTSVPGGKAEVD